MTQKLEVIKTNAGVYVISDGGHIARTLNIGNVPWHLVAPDAQSIPARIQQMEHLLNAAGVTPFRTTEDDAHDESVDQGSDNGVGDTERANGNGWAAATPVRNLLHSRLHSRHIARVENAGIMTMDDLLRRSRDDVLALPGVGEKIVGALDGVMDDLHITWKSSV